MDHAVPPGRLSVPTRRSSYLVPLLDTDTVNPAWSPAETEEASAILAMVTSPHVTAMLTGAPPEPSLEVVKVAALCRLGHSVLSVVVTTWTEAEAPAARVAGP